MLLAGQKVYVGPFLKRADRPMDRENHYTNVYVKNLPDSVDDDKLNEMFSQHGSVTSAVVMRVCSTRPPYATQPSWLVLRYIFAMSCRSASHHLRLSSSAFVSMQFSQGLLYVSTRQEQRI